MNVQMVYGLCTVLTAIADNAETGLVNLLNFSYLSDSFNKRCSRFAITLKNVVHVLLRNDQHMHGSLRIDIAESEYLIVLIYLIAGNIPGNDLAEQTIHDQIHLPTKDAPCGSIDDLSHGKGSIRAYQAYIAYLAGLRLCAHADILTGIALGKAFPCRLFKQHGLYRINHT